MKIFVEQLFQVLILAGIVQGPFIVLLLNNRGVRKNRANVFLSILLVALSFSIAHIVFGGAVVSHFSGKINALGDPTFFLISPLLWFYTRELTGQRVHWSWALALHFIPFYVIIAPSLVGRFFNLIPFSIQIAQNSRLIFVLFWVAVVVQFTGYQVLINRRWMVYQKVLQHEVSNTENVSVAWVKFFLAVFLSVNLFLVFTLFAAIHLDVGRWLQKSIALVFSVSVFALGHKGILQREVFNAFTPETSDNTSPTTEPLTAINKPINDSLMETLLRYMDEKKPYLDAELTLTTLAKALNISRSQLSHLINDGVGDNFYDFINKYRVEEVKKLMVDPQVNHYNVLGIAMEAGFKSKSTFNLVFKRFTGLTPTEYRKNILP